MLTQKFLATCFYWPSQPASEENEIFTKNPICLTFFPLKDNAVYLATLLQSVSVMYYLYTTICDG